MFVLFNYIFLAKMNDWRKKRLGKEKRNILSTPRKQLRHNLKNVFVKRTETADTNNIQVINEYCILLH